MDGLDDGDVVMDGEGHLEDDGPMDVEMAPEEMADKGHFEVKGILKHKYRQGGWRFLVWWSPPYTVQDATWEPVESFVVGKNIVNEHFEKYCEDHQLGDAMKVARQLAARFEEKNDVNDEINEARVRKEKSDKRVRKE